MDSSANCSIMLCISDAESASAGAFEDPSARSEASLLSFPSSARVEGIREGTGVFGVGS